jgi:hypothetical protein
MWGDDLIKFSYNQFEPLYGVFVFILFLKLGKMAGVNNTLIEYKACLKNWN